MKREQLIDAIRRAVTEAGWAFHTGDEHSIGPVVRHYPAAWLIPPVVKSKTGRRQGRIVYRVTLHLLALARADRRGEMWGSVEHDALTIAGTIACDPGVCALDNVSATPAHSSLTPHGEVSVTLLFDVAMNY